MTTTKRTEQAQITQVPAPARYRDIAPARRVCPWCGSGFRHDGVTDQLGNVFCSAGCRVGFEYDEA